jgi:exonuclease III
MLEDLEMSQKEEKIFSYISEKILVGILMFQETHSCHLDATKWQIEWGNKDLLFFNHGRSNARGTAIAIKNVNHTVNSYDTEINGRLQVLSINISDHENKLLLINIYNENVEAQQVVY